MGGTFLDSSFTDTDGTERNYVDTIMEAARNAAVTLKRSSMLAGATVGIPVSSEKPEA